jgi:hypothetical protein
VLVEVDEAAVLVMPEGVVMVPDLLIVPALLVVLLDLLMPAGLVIVLDFVVTRVAGVWAVVVILVVFDELLLIVPVAAGVGVAVWAWAAAPPSRLSETRKPRMRFMIKKGKRVRKAGPYTAFAAS